jgi:hypothetical protein
MCRDCGRGMSGSSVRRVWVTIVGVGVGVGVAAVGGAVAGYTRVLMIFGKSGQEAVGLWRDLDAADPTLHRPGLARAVGNVGCGLERVSRYDEALSAYREAVGLWRGLAEGSPRYESDLATALDRLRTVTPDQGGDEDVRIDDRGSRWHAT